MSDLQTEKENNKSKGQLSLEAIIYDNRAADEIKQLYIEHHGNKRQSRKTTNEMEIRSESRLDLEGRTLRKLEEYGRRNPISEDRRRLYPKMDAWGCLDRQRWNESKILEGYRIETQWVIIAISEIWKNFLKLLLISVLLILLGDYKREE